MPLTHNIQRQDCLLVSILDPAKRQQRFLFPGKQILSFSNLCNKNLNSQHTNLYFQYIMVYPLTPDNQIEVTSPFMASINDCRIKMKKLRKKIYKNLKAKQLSPKTPRSNNKKQQVLGLLREEKVPHFIKESLRSRTKGEGLADITNIYLPYEIDFDQVKNFANDQEKEIELMIKTMCHPTQEEIGEASMSEEQISPFHRMKSRLWLQSTQMEYQNESIMDMQSKVSLRPFELFAPDESSPNCHQDMNHLRESDGFISIESHNYLTENVFPF